MSWPILLLLLSLQVPLEDDAAYQEGQRLYEDFEYERAVFRFKEALRVKDRTPRDRAIVGLRLGMTYAELRDDQGAIEVFEKALQDDPLLVLPQDASPKIKEMLDQARQLVRDKRPDEQPPPSPPADPPPQVPRTPPATANPEAPLTALPPAQNNVGAEGALTGQTPPAQPAPGSATEAAAKPSAPPGSADDPGSISGDTQGTEVVPVVEESEGGGLPWLMISGAGVGVVGGLAMVGGAAAWGVGYYLYDQAEKETFQDVAAQHAFNSQVAQIAGYALLASSAVLLLSGAALASSSLMTGEFSDEEDGAAGEMETPLMEEVPTQGAEPASAVDPALLAEKTISENETDPGVRRAQ